MSTRDTSIKSYREIAASLGSKQWLVYETIRKLGSATDREIAKSLGYWDPNQVRPRRNELLKLGVIVEHEQRICTVTGKTAWTWKLKSSQ